MATVALFPGANPRPISESGELVSGMFQGLLLCPVALEAQIPVSDQLSS